MKPALSLLGWKHSMLLITSDRHTPMIHTQSHTDTNRYKFTAVNQTCAHILLRWCGFSSIELFVYSCCAAKTVYWACFVCVCLCRCAATKHRWRPSLMTSFVERVPVGVTNLKRAQRIMGQDPPCLKETPEFVALPRSTAN